MTQLAAPPDVVAGSLSAAATPRSGPARRRIAPRVVVAGACGVLALHFGITFLHVAPLNPLSQQFSALVSTWTSPFFTQNWELFAPDPVSRDTGVLVTGSIGGEEIGRYLDLSTPMLERKLHNPVPDNLHYTVSSVGHNMLSARQDVIQDPTVLAEHPDAGDQGLVIDPDVLADAPQGIQDDYERTLASAVDLAANALMREYGAQPDAVQIRIVTHEFPRWSQRADAGLGSVVYSDTPWLDMNGREVSR
ncbi:DUF5819 family protein [Microbacterium sp. RU33B]|uniref:DUF5819 family protein n=1 Tax=Microbacterium sp. RU33B TaxID=1907390 RepID=UPI00096A1C06|nr:DUF5819 family protein [Microbacterium sp. RU33B]SIT78530.1 hypothetical protein SAMN05880545_1900 [Microbacterium sp. RU33B]